MAKEIIHTMFVSELTDEMWFRGYRASSPYLNEITEARIKKKYYKKNGQPRKNHPYPHYPFMPVPNN